jgi:hypothetical protein
MTGSRSRVHEFALSAAQDAARHASAGAAQALVLEVAELEERARDVLSHLGEVHAEVRLRAAQATERLPQHRLGGPRGKRGLARPLTSAAHGARRVSFAERDARSCAPRARGSRDRKVEGTRGVTPTRTREEHPRAARETTGARRPLARAPRATNNNTTRVSEFLSGSGDSRFDPWQEGLFSPPTFFSPLRTPENPGSIPGRKSERLAGKTWNHSAARPDAPCGQVGQQTAPHVRPLSHRHVRRRRSRPGASRARRTFPLRVPPRDLVSRAPEPNTGDSIPRKMRPRARRAPPPRPVPALDR